MTEKFTTWGNRIKRNGTLLNIEFKTKFDAKLGCKLCNQMDKETQEFVDKVNELNRWHKDHYGKTILDERLEFKSPCEKENHKLKKENKELKQSISDWQGSYDELYEDNLKLEKEIKELQERNNRQYNQLGKLYELIEKQDWASLTTIIEDLKQAEEQLQKEWRTYGDLND